MKLTLTAIKADVGSIGGHIALKAQTPRRRGRCGRRSMSCHVIGIADWIDAETGEPAEGESPPHLQED